MTMPENKKSKALGIIPSRWASTRFPGKPLAEIGGRPMIEWVYRNASRAQSLDQLIVATDDQRIFDVVRGFGGEVVMTRSDHPSGTDRCAEVAKQLNDFDTIINIQGDEPFIAPEQIDLLVHLMAGDPLFQIGTLARPITEAAFIENPNVVKVVFDKYKRALYFSRSILPFQREEGTDVIYYQHLGIYAFKRDVLLKLSCLEPTVLERTESLEQLRWLEHGYVIGLGTTQSETVSIDHPEDIHLAEAWINNHKNNL
ncbi:MAG: 3-deoxy-manno-octulosonate cytidylyltransferase [Bacteroidota bacterium]